jgi:type IV secretory pathway VirB4 component
MSKAKKIERLKKEAALRETQNTNENVASQGTQPQNAQPQKPNNYQPISGMVMPNTNPNPVQQPVRKMPEQSYNEGIKRTQQPPIMNNRPTPPITSNTTPSNNTSAARQDTMPKHNVSPVENHIATEPKEEILPEKRNDYLGVSVVNDENKVEELESVDFVDDQIESLLKAQQAPKKKSMFGSLLGGSSNGNNEKKKKSKGIKDAPKTVQETIPYTSVYKNGIIEIEPGLYTKSYLLHDVNFQTAADEEQETIFTDYGNLLNSLGADVKAEVTVFNRNIDQEQFRKNTLLKMQHDNFDSYREEYNQILESKINEGRNNIIHEKYLTLTIEANGIDEASITFSRLDTEIGARIKKINGVETFPMTIEERLAVLYDIYNLNSTTPFNAKLNVKGQQASNFDLAWLKKQGITSKDIIAPTSMNFVNSNYFQIDDVFVRTLYIDNLPTFLSTDLIPEISSVPCNMLLSVHFDSMKQDKAIKLIRNQMVNINSNVVDAQKKASRAGYSADLISPELLKTQREAERIMSDMTSRNQKMFMMTMVVTVFADDKEELEKNTKSVQSVAQRFLCGLKPLTFQQEHGFTTSLPLGYNKIYVQRILTTESASLFIPFSAQELSQKNGMYYGLNAVSRNLLLFNRINSKNANGVILGTPGSGKSFSAKREMLNVFLGTNDDIYIIDPEREYSPLAALFGGQVVKIAAGSKTYINPLDMDLDYADEDDPITLKSDFIGSLCETVIGGRYGLAPIQKSVIDRCVRQVYQPYMEHMKRLADKSITCDKSAMPTLDDFYELLLQQPEPESQNIALALELYCRGTLDTFAHKTNVQTKSRFVVYDIKDIGSGMKEMGLQVCLNDIWNKIIENKKRGKRTWFYIDEFYLLTQTESSARFLQQIWKRARKWGGVPTGITQNVEDLLASKEARGIINNCDFVLMLNQAPLDRIELGHMLNISPTQMSYITNADAGQGLIYTGKFIVPFLDKFPTGNSLYKAMTTKPDEVDLSKVTV